MKKLLLLTAILFLTTALFGMRNNYHADYRATNHADFEFLNDLREAGYTILPEVRVVAYRNPQDTIKHKQQRFSSRFETKGGRGYMLPEWADDSTWTPGSKPPQEKSNYEKYWEEKNGMQMDKPMHMQMKSESKPEFDDLYYQPSKDGKMMKHQMMKRDTIKRDTIKKTSIIKDPITINNYYYDDDPFFYSRNIGRFYHGGFNYWHYNPFFYDPWYDDFGWGWNPYYGYNYPYYGGFYFGWNNYWGWNFGWNYGWNMYHPYYGGHNNFYGHNNNWNGGFQSKPQYGRRERPANFTQTNPTTNRRLADKQPQGNRIGTPQQRMVNPQGKATYGDSRRSYQPTYETPRMSTRPAYNNSKGINRTTERRTEISTESRTIMQSNPQRRSESQRYSAPTRSYSPAPNRSSEPQGFGKTMNFNSGGSDRRSSGSNFSSGSNSSSSGSAGNSGSSRSSGGSSSGRR